MSALLTREFPASTAALGEIRDAVRTACHAAGCPPEETDQWVMAINEACMNIIQHGYRFAEGRRLHIDLLTDGKTLSAVLSDNGEAVRLEDLRPRALEDLRPGGLGVRFMRELTDTMAYLPPNDAWQNRLQLTKRIK